MRRLLWFISLAALAGLPLAAAPHRAQAEDCRPRAIEKLRAAANGFAIYQRITDKAFFLGWIACADADLGLSTAVHESVHFITAERDAFPLVGGGEIKRPHEASGFFAPSLIAGQFKANAFVSSYLRPGAARSS